MQQLLVGNIERVAETVGCFVENAFFVEAHTKAPGLSHHEVDASPKLLR
ncbi:hypothetical protein AAII07_52505 [Microvirga sp. 0TCS3.31]